MTVVRLPGAHGSPPERVLTTVGRVDLGLADALHAPSTPGDRLCRPYAVARRRDSLDVVCFDDAVASALLRGEPAARLVVRVPLAALGRDGRGERTIRLAFDAPTAFRVKGFDHLIPDAPSVFGSLRTRWDALCLRGADANLGWPPLPRVETLLRIPVWPETLGVSTHPMADGRPQRGFVGAVRFEVSPLSDEDRAVLWTLARFGELRGVGRGTSYGLGRVRVLRPGERWRPGEAGARGTAGDRGGGDRTRRPRG